jgi:hypothetical protein
VGLIGIRDRPSDPTPQQRRKAFLHLAYEAGFKDGFYLGDSLGRFSGDEEARLEYLKGCRIGKREKNRRIV